MHSLPIVDKLLKGKYWKWKVTISLFMFSMLFNTPYFNYLPGQFNDLDWVTVMKQVESDTLYQPEGMNPDLHRAKITFRLTVPFIAKVLHLNEMGIYLLQFLLGILLLFLTVTFVDRISGSKYIAFYFALGFTAIYAGRVCFTDLLPNFTSYCFVFLFLAIFFKNPFLVFVTSSLAAWTDERGAIALVFVLLWWKYRENGSAPFNSLKTFFRLRKNSIAVLTAGAFYLAGRTYMHNVLGLYTPPEGANFSVITRNLEIAQIGFWTIFEGMWLLILYKFFILWKEKKYLFLFTNLFIDAVMLLGALMVHDITRSGSFMFIDLFISLMLIYYSRGIEVLSKWLFYACIISVLFPSYLLITNSGPLILQRSIFFTVVKQLVQLIN